MGCDQHELDRGARQGGNEMTPIRPWEQIADHRKQYRQMNPHGCGQRATPSTYKRCCDCHEGKCVEQLGEK
jgi:hypothetical protein